jgi:hypothetical protein
LENIVWRIAIKAVRNESCFLIACCTHTFKCATRVDFICGRLEMYHAATNKLVNSRCLLLIDLPEFEVLKSFLFTDIVNFDDIPTS